MIKIYVNTPSWSFGASTDRNLQKRMKILSKIYPDLEFYYPHNKVLSLWINIKHFISVPLKSGQININQTIPEKGKN